MMNCGTVSAIEVSIIPIAKNAPPTTLTFLYPNALNNGPLIKPNDIANAEFIFIIIVRSAAGTFIASNLSLKIKPKQVVVGITISYIQYTEKENNIKICASFEHSAFGR